jgi:hypothetical protein
MKRLRPACIAIAAMLLFAGGVLAADAPAKPDQAVVVTAMRDPVDKSYRKMIRGMDLFEQLHAMAPGAVLRYKLLPRQRTTNMAGIVVEIVAATITLPVEVAADRSFTLERDAIALAEDASVMPNRKAASLTWRTDIRTPGLPSDTRRLGDLRLECRVGLEAGLVSNSLPGLGAITSLIHGMTDFCNGADAPYLFFADRPLFSVTLSAGARRETLSIDALYAGMSYGRITQSDLAYCDCQVLLDRTYFLPLGDRSWPDDTLVGFEYMDAAAVTGALQ